MKQDEIKNETYEVTILRFGREEDTSCYKLHNEELGEFIMGNCHCNIDPSLYSNAEHYINGNVELYIDGEKVSYFAALAINQHDSNHGIVTLR